MSVGSSQEDKSPVGSAQNSNAVAEDRLTPPASSEGLSIPRINLASAFAAEDVRQEAERDSVFALDEDAGVLNGAEDHFTDDFDPNVTSEGTRRSHVPTSAQSKGRRVHYAPTPNDKQKPVVAASLPVAINGGSYWPRGNEMHDESQLEEEDESSSDSNPEDRIFRNMQFLSRSIQPDDDPERLFGPRPHRRPRDDDGGPITVAQSLRSDLVGAGGAAGGPRIIIPSSLSRYA